MTKPISRFALVVAAAPMALPSVACSTTECTDELRAYTLDLTRTAPASSVKASDLAIDLCVGDGGTGCSRFTLLPDGRIATANGIAPVLSGAVTANGSGGLTFALKVRIDEQPASSRLPITIKATGPNQQLVLETSASVAFSDAECHPGPTSTAL